MILSTTEFVAAAGAASQTIWIKEILRELGYLQLYVTTVLS
jgi:hypothetical protein